MSYRVTDKEVEALLGKIELEEEKLENSVQMFHEDWDVQYHLNSLVIITAASGVGKSTFLRQDLKECVYQELQALVFSNEEEKSTILMKVVNSFMKTEKVSKKKALKEVLRWVTIIDVKDTHDVFFHDKVPDMIMSGIEEYEPDIVFFNNITNCKSNEDGDRRKAFDYLPELVDEFNEYINSEDLRPPIILYQQGKSILGENAGDSNKDATNTVNTATHVIQLVREGEYTIVETQKYRHAPETGTKRFHKFQYDPYYDDFEFIEKTNTYDQEKKRRRRRF